eukprot:TRINITY_DN6553_c0_g1_i1.p1 TRINITY_DN6553_c0_g1~~TRINITY_DN6553_c0_g1_i1.p1  ORF type:complete len:325 (-),score=55.65 TRINITY_DN6553_c0_g1_i1:39-989(-)
MDISLYLTYFHESGGIEKTFERLQQDQNLEETNDPEYLSSFCPDLKEGGGTGKELVFGFGASYKKPKAKAKPKNWDLTIRIRQDDYRQSKAGWKVWDSALVLSRWLYANSGILRDKTVHELGCGCGLVGILAACFAKQVWFSDYLPGILENLRSNITINRHILPEDAQEPRSCQLDWSDFNPTKSHYDVTLETVDVILGSDLVYGIHLAEALPPVVNALLKSDGVFYAVMPRNRWGIDQFMDNMEALGFSCSRTFPEEEFWCDLSKKNHWYFFEFRRGPKKYERTLQQDEKVDDEIFGSPERFFDFSMFKKKRQDF